MKARFLHRLGPDPDPSGFDSVVNSFMATPGNMLASYQELFGFAEEADKRRAQLAFDYPAQGTAALAGGAFASAIPSATALAAGIAFPPAAGPLAWGVLTAYGLSSAGDARRIVREHEETTGEDISDGAEVAMMLGYGASAAVMEKLGMKAGTAILKKQVPGLFKNVGESLLNKNIPEAAKIIGAMAIEEGFEEGAEQLAQNSLTAMLVNPDQELLEGVGEAGLGGLMGGGFGSFPLLPKSVRRAARGVKGVEKGEAPPNMRVAPPPDPRTADIKDPLVVKAEVSNIQLAREAMMLSLDPAKAKTFAEARNWSNLSRVAAGEDPALMTGTQPLGVANTAAITQGEQPSLPDQVPQPLSFDNTLFTNELIETAYMGVAFAKQDVERVSSIGQVPNAEMAALELSESELIYAWNQANPKDFDSSGLMAYIADKEAQGPPTKRAAAGAKWTKIWEKQQPSWTRGIRPAEGRAERESQRAAEEAQRQEEAELSKAEIRKRRRAEAREAKRIAKLGRAKPGSIGALEDEIEARKEEGQRRENQRFVDLGDQFIGQETTDTSVQTLNEDDVVPGGGLKEEQNVISEASGKDKAEPSPAQRQRLALPLQTSGILGRVIQTPGQLINPSTGAAANAILDRETGTVYLSADVDFDTIGHEGFHRLLDLLGRDSPIAQQMLGYYKDKKAPEEALSDDVGQYYADRIQAGPAKRLGGWMSDMWVAAKDAVGVELTQDELIQAANIHLKSAPNGRGQSGYLSQIRAYHGSGEEYDEMDAQYLLSGEGHMAFGAGFYFTSVYNIAKFYANKIGGQAVRDDAEVFVTLGGKKTKINELEAIQQNKVTFGPNVVDLKLGRITVDKFVSIVNRISKSQIATMQKEMADADVLSGTPSDHIAKRVKDRYNALISDLQVLTTLKASDIEVDDPSKGSISSKRLGLATDDFFLNSTIYDAANALMKGVISKREFLTTLKVEIIKIKSKHPRGSSDAADLMWVKLEKYKGIKASDLDVKEITYTTSRHIYTVDIHKGKDPSEYDYLDWYEVPTDTQLEKITKAAHNMIRAQYAIAEEQGKFIIVRAGADIDPRDRRHDTRESAQKMIEHHVNSQFMPYITDIDQLESLLAFRFAIFKEGDGFVLHDMHKGELDVLLTRKEAEDAMRFAIEAEAEEIRLKNLGDKRTANVQRYYHDLTTLAGLGDATLNHNEQKIAASNALLAEGVDGITYPAGSLGGSGTKGPAGDKANYVVFDPAAVTIEDRYSFQDKKEKEYAANVNLSRIAIDEAAEKSIQDNLSDSADPTYMSNEELDVRARKIIDQKGLVGMEALAQRYRETGQASLEEAHALNLYSTSGFVNALEDWTNGSDPDIRKVLKQQAEHDFELASMLSKDAGRRLQARNIMREPYALWNTLQNLEGQLSEEDAAYLMQIVKDGSINDAQTALDFNNRLKKPTAKNYFFEYFYNSILSGIPTHMVNVGNNALWLAFQLPHRALNAAVDKTLSSELMHSIAPSLHQESRKIFLDEVIPMWKGIKSRTNKTYRYLVEEKGMDPETFDRQQTKWRREIGQSFEAWERSPYKIMRDIAPYLTFPSKALEAQDMFFHALAFDAQLNALIVRDAKQRGISIEEAVANPRPEIIADATQFAEYATFMDAPGTLATNIIRLRDKVPFGVGRLIVPFVNTLTNILKRGVEITPGLGALASKKDVKAGKTEVSEVITKQVEGLILSMMTALAFGEPDEEGDFPITGAVPRRQAERDAFYRQGKIPYAIKMNGTWVSYRKFEPFALPLAITANILEATKREDVQEAELMEYISTLGNVTMRTIISSTYTENVSRLLDDKGIQRVAERLPSSMVPFSSFFRSFNRAGEALMEGDATLRETKGVMAAMANTIPFSSQFIDDEGKARLNNFGEEIKLPGSWLRQWLPFKWSDTTNDPIEQELERLDQYPGLPSKEVTIAGEKHELPDELWREYAILYGVTTKEAIGRVMGGRRYARLSDAQKSKVLDRAIRRARGPVTERVKRLYLRQNPQDRRGTRQ